MDEDIFNSLVSSAVQQLLAHTLVRLYISQSPGSDAFIYKRGRGLIEHLVVPPGADKTLTAEAVREMLSRSLYVLGSGELVSSPEYIEFGRHRVMEPSQSGRAVLFLDESDGSVHEHRK